jgi:hypothetical protein
MSLSTRGNVSCMIDGEGQRITCITNCSPFALEPAMHASAPYSGASSPIDIPRCREPDYSPGGSYQSPVAAACVKRKAEPDDLQNMLKAARLASPSCTSNGLSWRDTHISLGESPSARTAHTVDTRPPTL